MDEDYPMTVHTLYRWVYTALMAESLSYPPKNPVNLNFIIFPVQVHRFSDEGLSHFEFRRFPASRGLDPKSRQQVVAGVYALYRRGKELRFKVFCVRLVF